MSYESDILATSGLIHYWKLDEASGATFNDEVGTLDLAFGANITPGATKIIGNGTGNSATFSRSAGLSGADASFAGESFRVFNISYEGWYDPPVVGTPETDLICFLFNGAGSNGFGLFVYNGNMQILYNEVAWLDTSIAAIAGPQHIVLTISDRIGGADSIKYTLYRNGLEIWNNTYGYPPGPTTKFTVGGQQSQDARTFLGRVDEFSVYHAELDAATVLAHYNSGIDSGVGTTITAAGGVYGVGASWVGGVVPGDNDNIVIPTGVDLIVADFRQVNFWTQQGSGRILLYSDSALQSKLGGRIEGDGTFTGEGRVKVRGYEGSKLLFNPGVGETAELRVGLGNNKGCTIWTEGIKANRCVIGKADGAAGKLVYGNITGNAYASDPFYGSFFDVVGFGDASTRASHELSLGGVEWVMRNVNFIECGEWNLQMGGLVDWIGCKWSDSVGNPLFSITCGDGTNLAISYCSFDKPMAFYALGGNPGNAVFTNNIHKDAWSGTWDKNKVYSSGHFFFNRVSADYAFPGTHEKCYHMVKFPNPGSGGNTHFWVTYGGLTLKNCIFEYHGPYNVDTGDIVVHSGNSDVLIEDCITVRTPVPGKAPGGFSMVGGSGGKMRMRHSTVFIGDGGGFLYPHGGNMIADSISEVKSNIFWSDENASGPAFVNDDPANAATDAVNPSGVSYNAFVGLSTGTNNTVNGVGGVSILGFSGAELSALPTGNIPLPVGGAEFVDDSRTFETWARVVRGHTGTADEVIDAAVADIENDPVICRLLLRQWVKAGYHVQASELTDTGHDGENIGALTVPLGWPAYPESLDVWMAKLQDPGTAPARAAEMIAAWELWEGGGGNDDTMAITYYDATRVWLQINERFETINPTLASQALLAAEAAAKLYVDTFLIPGGYGAAGYWNFTTGLKMLYQKTGNTKWRDAVFGLALNAAYATDPVSDSALIDRIRENAYAVISHLDAEELGAAHRASTDVKIATLKSHVGMLNAREVSMQVFMAAIAVEALWRVYQWDTDTIERAEIVNLISDVCDVAMDRWEADTGWFYYGVDDSRDLNNLIAPMYAIAWHKTGLTRHRDNFDMVFGHGVAGGWMGPQKQFNQQSKWIWDDGIDLRAAEVNTSHTDEGPGEDPVLDFTLAGPTAGEANSPSTSFTVTIGAGTLTGTARFTPSASTGSGIFVPTYLDLDNATRSGTFLFIPFSTGFRVITAPDNRGLSDPAGIGFTATPPATPPPAPPDDTPRPGNSIRVGGSSRGATTLIIRI